MSSKMQQNSGGIVQGGRGGGLSKYKYIVKGLLWSTHLYIRAGQLLKKGGYHSACQSLSHIVLLCFRLRNMRYTFNLVMFLIATRLVYIKSRIARELWSTMLGFCIQIAMKFTGFVLSGNQELGTCKKESSFHPLYIASQLIVAFESIMIEKDVILFIVYCLVVRCPPGQFCTCAVQVRPHIYQGTSPTKGVAKLGIVNRNL